MLIDEFKLRAAAPVIKRITRPSTRIERCIETPLGKDDHDALAEAAKASGQRLGDFYHWYYQKLLVSRHVRSVDRAGIEQLIARSDKSDYAELDLASRREGGLLIAIPHHGHYITAMIAIARRIAHHRKVLIFYGDPATHAGNEVFDHLAAVLFCDPNCGVEVIHDTRAGMMKAIRGLQEGAAVLIMPDVHKRATEAYQVPFCGRALSVMLGTAILARKTGSTVIPVVSSPVGDSFGFRNIWGPVARPAAAPAAAADEVLADYAVTAAIFAFYEQVMAEEILYWQFVRQHYLSELTFPLLEPEQLEDVTTLVLGGPGCNLALDRLIDLDAVAAEPASEDEVPAALLA